jgi:hypothetical protein
VNYTGDTDIYEHGIISSVAIPGLTLLATTRHPIHNAFTLAIVDTDGSSLNERAIRAGDVVTAHAVRDYYHESDMRYCIRASLYHLNRIIDMYVETCRLFEEIHPTLTRKDGNTSDGRIFFEIDAFLSAARRAYDAISNVIWKHYMPARPGRWDSGHAAITWMAKHPGEIPTEIADVYKQSWDVCGEKLTDYRDYIMHHVPLVFDGEIIWMNGFEDRWGATVQLPANPEAKSRARSNPTKDIDALNYCHSVAREVLKLAEFLVAQPTVRDYLENPPGYPRQT